MTKKLCLAYFLGGFHVCRIRKTGKVEISVFFLRRGREFGKVDERKNQIVAATLPFR